MIAATCVSVDVGAVSWACPPIGDSAGEVTPLFDPTPEDVALQLPFAPGAVAVGTSVALVGIVASALVDAAGASPDVACKGRSTDGNAECASDVDAV